jgi:hypothetical protein
MGELASNQPVAVCGAGAAGLGAALAVARSGTPVELIEAGARVGGTVANSLLHTLAGLYDTRGEYLNPGIATELAERLLRGAPHVRRRRMGKVWVLNVDPELYRRVVEAWVASEPLITLRLETRVTGGVRAGARVRALELSRRGERIELAVRSAVDASGSAALVSALDPRLIQPDTGVRAGGWIFRMRGVLPRALEFPANVGVVRAVREAAASGALPASCTNAWIDAGLEHDEVFVKLFVPLEPGWQDREARGEISELARRVQHELAAFLRSLEGFEDARVIQTGRLGIRDGGRARGEYVLTRGDVLGARKFHDAACRSAWPIEYWDSRRGVSLEYLPDGEYYEIPLRSLKLRGVENVWVAGKCLSADPYAQASARAAGTCWAMGAASGGAARAAGHPSKHEERAES